MSDRILVSTRKGIFILVRKNGNWEITEKAFLGAPVTIALHDPRSDYLFCGVGHGHFGAKMHRSKNGGKSWEECGTPNWPEKPEDAPVYKNPYTQKEIPWSLEYLWALETGGNDGQLWCGTIPGGLFRSNDNGDSWELNRSLWDLPNREKWFGGGFDSPGIHSICIDPRDSKHLTLAISCGGVWQSFDEGKTWKATTKGMRAEYMPPEQADDPDSQDPHLLAHCTSNPDTQWVQHHNGIFKSTDGANTWTEIEKAGPSTFGFAVAIHPEDGNTAWFVPGVKDEIRIPVDGKFVVTRTRDGGENFDVLTKGLPQVDAYDIVFRHGLAVDETGERLVMGSTTGSVWISENSGDDWVTFSTHLPPVYSVRFF